LPEIASLSKSADGRRIHNKNTARQRRIPPKARRASSSEVHADGRTQVTCLRAWKTTIPTMYRAPPGTWLVLLPSSRQEDKEYDLEGKFSALWEDHLRDRTTSIIGCPVSDSESGWLAPRLVGCRRSSRIQDSLKIATRLTRSAFVGSRQWAVGGQMANELGFFKIAPEPPGVATKASAPATPPNQGHQPAPRLPFVLARRRHWSLWAKKASPKAATKLADISTVLPRITEMANRGARVKLRRGRRARVGEVAMNVE